MRILFSKPDALSLSLSHGKQGWHTQFQAPVSEARLWVLINPKSWRISDRVYVLKFRVEIRRRKLLSLLVVLAGYLEFHVKCSSLYIAHFRSSFLGKLINLLNSRNYFLFRISWKFNFIRQIFPDTVWNRKMDFSN